ncbi:MAG: hypothetical protein ACE365_05545 [Gammaproteobacteria bacterium]
MKQRVIIFLISLCVGGGVFAQPNQLKCDIFYNGKQVSTQTMPIDNSLVTSAWGRQNPETYFSNYYRPQLCQSVGAGETMRSLNIKGGHNIKVYDRSAAYSGCEVKCVRAAN